MKNNKIFLILIFFISPIYGQNKILGFGKLKIGMKISEVSEIKDAAHLSKFNRGYDPSIRSAYELIPDTNNSLSEMVGFLNKDARIFIVPKIQITDQIEINQVELIFFLDSLVSIRCGYDEVGWVLNSSIRRALTIKYGYPREQKIVGTVWKWNSGDPSIVCEEYLHEFYISYKKYYNYYLKLENSYKMKLIEEKENADRKIIEEREKKLLISNL